MEKTMLRRVMVGLTIVVIALVVFSAPVVREKIAGFTKKLKNSEQVKEVA